MKIIAIVAIVCAYIFGQVVPDLIGLNKPNPTIVADKVNDCLQKEFIPLADAAVPVVLTMSHLALLLSNCDPPTGFDEDVWAKTQNTLTHYADYEAVNCSLVVYDAQTACVLEINGAAQAKLAEEVLNAVSNSVTDVQSVAQCQNPDFPTTLGVLLKLLYDRVGLVPATITTLNVENIFNGLPGCVTVPVIDVTVPL